MFRITLSKESSKFERSGERMLCLEVWWLGSTSTFNARRAPDARNQRESARTLVALMWRYSTTLQHAGMPDNASVSQPFRTWAGLGIS